MFLRLRGKKRTKYAEIKFDSEDMCTTVCHKKGVVILLSFTGSNMLPRNSRSDTDDCATDEAHDLNRLQKTKFKYPQKWRGGGINFWATWYIVVHISQCITRLVVLCTKLVECRSEPHSRHYHLVPWHRIMPWLRWNTIRNSYMFLGLAFTGS